MALRRRFCPAMCLIFAKAMFWKHGMAVPARNSGRITGWKTTQQFRLSALFIISMKTNATGIVITTFMKKI